MMPGIATRCRRCFLTVLFRSGRKTEITTISKIVTKREMECIIRKEAEVTFSMLEIILIQYN